METIWDEYGVYEKVDENQVNQFDVIIVGGGAAGMMAAGTAAQNGLHTLLLEKNSRLGRKLRITGKGRCNIVNNCDVPTAIAAIPSNGRFYTVLFPNLHLRTLLFLKT